ncbi:nucleotide-diphospho-sugar transferase, partial [Cerioporus squamosus]
PTLLDASHSCHPFPTPRPSSPDTTHRRHRPDPAMALKLTTTSRYVLLVLVIIIGLHSILSFTHADYGRATSFKHIASQLSWGSPSSDAVPDDRRANTTILMLARNSDVDNAVRSARRLEDRFNKKFGYPWVFLNEEPFSDEFKTRVSNVINGEVTFGLVPRSTGTSPNGSTRRATAGREKMVADNNNYSRRERELPEHCPLQLRGASRVIRLRASADRRARSSSTTAPAAAAVQVVLGVEPDVHFHCDIDFDPFLFMEDHNKTYAFTITMYEFGATIPTLWDSVKEFVQENAQYVARDNAMGYMSEDGGNTYNNCHFWSNFEIADMDFWRSEAYSKFFEHLDRRAGSTTRCRWGDAPVHSIAAALFQSKEQIHFFDEIGYEHNPYTHCPKGEGAWARGKCGCDPKRSFDYDGYSCMRQWERMWR